VLHEFRSRTYKNFCPRIAGPCGLDNETAWWLRNLNFDYLSVKGLWFLDGNFDKSSFRIQSHVLCSYFLIVRFCSMGLLYGTCTWLNLCVQVLHYALPIASVALIKGTLSSCRIPGHHVLVYSCHTLKLWGVTLLNTQRQHFCFATARMPKQVSVYLTVSCLSQLQCRLFALTKNDWMEFLHFHITFVDNWYSDKQQ
jgi:hypothetical protein